MNPRRPTQHFTALLLAALLFLISQAASAEPRKPNIIYMMADELAYFEVGCMGSQDLKTPNIDRFAAEGILFTQALAGNSVCAPTRCCLMTGKHSGHTSVRENDGGTPMRAGEETIASMLRREGYATGGFGKWGCGGRGSTGVPEKHGFDEFVGYYDQVHAHSFYPAYIVDNSEELPLANNHGLSDGETYSHYVIMDRAMQFIRKNHEKPFFCYLPITPPHGAYDIPDDDPAWAMFADKPWPEDAKRYAAMVAMVDRNLGEVLTLLRELGVEENTLVFFCGDNGGQDRFPTAEHPRGFFGPNVNPKTGQGFRGSKTNLYEGGLRIPMFARWPGKIQPGQVSDLLWYFPDVLPTVAEATGAEVPSDIDGISILPTLLGEDAVGREQEQHEYLYWEFRGQTAVRLGDWKAVQPKENANWELYDLSQDLSEEVDLAGKQPDVLARMTAMAEEAHEPVEEGLFHDREIHERDRRAKFGDSRQEPSGASNSLPTEGLLDHKGVKILRASSEADSKARRAAAAIDGDPRTHWHTEFQPVLMRHPHELVLDLGQVRTIRGFSYLARQDSGWNGSIKQCEFYISNSPDQFAEPVVKAEFRKVKTAQEIDVPPTAGRYVLLKVISEVDGRAWASIAELGVVGE